MSKKKKILVWGLTAVFLAGLLGLIFWSTQKPADPGYILSTVERGDVFQTVSVTGSLSDKQELNLDFEIGGRIGKIFFKEGEKVAQGEPIAELESDNLTLLKDQAETSLAKARADDEGNNESLRELEEEENAEDYLDETKELNDQKLKEADQAVENAEDYYDDVKDYYDENPTAQNKVTLTAAENSLKASKEAKKTLERQCELNEVSAENSLKTVRSKIETLEAESSTDSRNAVLENAKKNLEVAKINLGKTVLPAPVGGTVSLLNFKEGEIFNPTGGHFGKIIGNELLIEAEIPESDVLKLKKGLTAEFTLDSLSETEKFKAEVLEIRETGTNIQDVISYKTTFRLNGSDNRFKPEMTVNLDIETDKKQNVLKIPGRAVKTEGDQKYVEIEKEDGQLEKRSVVIGLEGDEGVVEVKSGLTEGEKVVTFKKE